MKEKDIKIYYTSGQKKAQIEPFIQQILSASCLTDAIEAYLNMKACISPKWVKEYLDKTILLNGKSVKFKDLPIFKRVKEEARKYVIVPLEVIMGITKDENGNDIFLTATKEELLKTRNDSEIMPAYYERKTFYDEMNKAIKMQDIKTLAENYDELSNNPCYAWVISYFDLKPSVRLERKFLNRTSQNN